ncbi:MAG: hypothetical protein NZ895_03745 [Archaeoglobaceae archaeon]|nr:hypothetical protein [Archaeoglobaceae archaeon]MCX8152422.1 hypothetical protein [Archaeoglobaceae archaeon]MDW8013762.1 hypothetical protein [Archaeoglobaceae archaeon]
MRRELEDLQIQLRRGKHSKVYLFERYAIKKFDEKFKYNFFKEVKFLTLLQPFRFVPRLFSVDLQELKIVMQRVEGRKIFEVMSADLAIKCLEICFILDTLNIQKEEMNHPEKHIIINKNNNIYFIDFERSFMSKKPSNVTQFCTYLKRFGFLIDKDLLKEYKKNYSRELLEKIKEQIKFEFLDKNREG